MAKTTKEDNLSLWNRVCVTNPKYTKEIPGKGSLKLTAIGAQFQKKNATKEFGIYGEAWGLKEVKYKIIKDLPPNGETIALCEAVFFHPTGQFPISSAIKIVAWNTFKKYHMLDDDFAKKVETDILTKALSYLGFNADVFMGDYNDNKYIAKVTEQFAEENGVKPAAPRMKKMTDTVYNQGMAAIESGDESKIANLKKYLNGVEDCERKVEMLNLINKK